MDFSSHKSFNIPEGEVIKVESEGAILWDKFSQFKYSGTLSYDNDATMANLICNENVGNDFVNEVYISGGVGGAYVVKKIEDGKVYYSDGTGDYDDGWLNIINYGIQSPIGVSVSARASDDTDLIFRGKYTWGYRYNNE